MEFDHREQELICQIEELQQDVHRLNNMVNPILPLAPAVEEYPNVLIAEDNAMEVDAEAEPEEEVESCTTLVCMLVCLRSFVISSDYWVYMDTSMTV